VPKVIKVQQHHKDQKVLKVLRDLKVIKDSRESKVVHQRVQRVRKVHHQRVRRDLRATLRLVTKVLKEHKVTEVVLEVPVILHKVPVDQQVRQFKDL
jgi:hypothetical protein